MKMEISESQFEIWSHQGSKSQSASTYKTVKGVLNDSRSPYYKWLYRIFLQGSYGNDTNIYADSDVDIVICLESVYYSDLQHLNDQEKGAQIKKYKQLTCGLAISDLRIETSWIKSNSDCPKDRREQVVDFTRV